MKIARMRCLWLCKDTKFKAIHNVMTSLSSGVVVVYDYAKILNLKQFTTSLRAAYALQSCLWLCKDTKFKAIHNRCTLLMLTVFVVYDYAKILNLKQFTTEICHWLL